MSVAKTTSAMPTPKATPKTPTLAKAAPKPRRKMQTKSESAAAAAAPNPAAKRSYWQK
jgi:hypothetical protein